MQIVENCNQIAHLRARNYCKQALRIFKKWLIYEILSIIDVKSSQMMND